MLTVNSRGIREITLTPKITMARTQYYDMSNEDSAYIYEWLIKFLADATELATHDAGLKKEWFATHAKQWPRGRKGANSLASTVAGIVAHKMHNPSHNISEPLLQSIETIFDLIHDLYEQLPNSPQTVRFKISFIVYE